MDKGYWCRKLYGRSKKIRFKTWWYRKKGETFSLNAATSKEKGAEIFVGGRFGREMRLGDSLGRIFKEEEIIPVIDKIVEASKELGQTEERVSKTLDRIGAETFVNRVLEMVDGK